MATEAPPGLTMEPGLRAETQRMLETMLRREPLLREVPEAHSVSTDPVDVAQALEEETTCLAVLERDCELRAQAAEAFSRLAEGRYGSCAGCGNPIPLARLRAVPCAVRCLACQERFEARRKVTVPPLFILDPADEE
jgi:DnaK suppressor protein